MKVLIADDDPSSCLLLESLLIKWGYEVTVAHDGDEAWRILCLTEHPLLVILDWMMPGIEGPAIVSRLREREGPLPHYVIIITSKEKESATVHALNAGADDFVAKPFSQCELQARVAVGFRVNHLHMVLMDKMQKLEQATETISRLARTDELTGLHNRRSFNENFSLAISTARRHNVPLSLVSIDLDHFKRVNDDYGHRAGDQVLQMCASLLLEMVREEDIVARWGGEEFIIVLLYTDGDSAITLAERVRSRFEQTPAPLVPYAITASFGVAQFKQECETEDALLRRVDDALYSAKSQGRNRVIVAM